MWRQRWTIDGRNNEGDGGKERKIFGSKEGREIKNVPNDVIKEKEK